MKTKTMPKPRQEAVTLLVVLVTFTIFAFAIMGYLSVIEHQNYLCVRAQSWDKTMTIVEAGLEEGLAHLNNSTNNLGIDNWTQSGSIYTCPTRNFPDGSSYTVSIDNSDPFNPSVVSHGSVTPPPSIYSLNQQSLFLAAGGQTLQAQSPPIKRAVRVTTTKSPLFVAAMVSKKGIDLRGNGIYSDSFDSSNNSKSTNGHYNGSFYSGDNGDIASNGGIYDSVDIQNANIYGKVHTGPNEPVSVGPNGGVGTHSWLATHDGFQDGYVLQDANFTFPDTKLPDTAGAETPEAGDVVTTHYNVTSTSTSSTNYPSPPPSGGVITNTGTIIVAVVPSPPPAGLQTNTAYTTSSTFPLAGTYVGNVATNVVTSGPPAGRGTWYLYYAITGYSYPLNTYVYNLYSTNVTYTTNHYDGILQTGHTYVSSDLTGSNYVAGTDVTLILPNGMDGGENLIFKSGAKLEIYCGGTSVTISGNQIINPNGNASSLKVYCDPSVTSFTLNGNGEFVGVLVAPNVDLVMNGGGALNRDFIGSLMVKSVIMNGHFSFHYDEALRNEPNKGRFLITSWDEINPN